MRLLQTYCASAFGLSESVCFLKDNHVFEDSESLYK